MSFPTPPNLERLNKRNPPNIVMKDFILKTLFSRIGPIVKALVSSILGWLVTWTAGLGILIEADLQTTIATALSGIIWVTIDFLVNKYLGDHVAVIQKAYGLEADRWLGPKTTAAAIDPHEIPRPTEILP